MGTSLHDIHNDSASRKKESIVGRAAGSLAELWRRRWLTWYFVWRQLAQSYRSSFLGILWIFLGPLLMVALYTAVFGSLLGLREGFGDGVSVKNYGLYVYCGIVPFLAYAQTVNKAVSVIRQNSTLVLKVVFPLEILPLSTAAANIIDQVFGFGALMVLAMALGQGFHWTVVLVPLVMIPQLLFVLGLGYLGAVVGTYLPDVQETLKAVVRASFFVTPVIWPASLAEERGLDWVVDYNPLAILIDAYRDLILLGRLPDLMHLSELTLFAAALCVVSYLLFLLARDKFADLI